MLNINIYIVLCVIYNFNLTKVKLGGVSDLEIERSRTLEVVLGVLGGVFGLFGGVIALIFSAFESSILGLAVSAILASIVGLVGTVYVTQNPRNGGLILIISAVWLLISISAFGVIGSVFLGIAGLAALIRK